MSEQGRLIESGIARIEWSDRGMPVLQAIRAQFERDRPLEGMRVGACLHVTSETANLVRALIGGGAEVHLAASNPLATQNDVAAALHSEYGAVVRSRRGAGPASYVEDVVEVVRWSPHIMLDDGCDLVSTLHATFPDNLSDVIGACEQTTTGVLRLRAMQSAGALRIPVVTVNDTATKRMFDNRFGTGQSTVDAILRATNILLAGSVFVVAGFGSCGRGVAERARGMGADVVITEVDPLKALDATLEGYRVLPMDQAAAIGDVFVTVTGNREVIRGEHMAAMKDGAVLANSGHFDVEIDVAWLSAHGERQREVRPEVDAYVLDSGRRLLLIAGGRLANLSAAEGHPASVMDMSFADQALSAAWLAAQSERLQPGLYGVPAHIDAAVASLKLASLGVRIDTLTADQESYLGSWDSTPVPGARP